MHSQLLPCRFPHATTSKGRRRWIVATVLWLAGIAATIVAGVRYEFTPGEQKTPPSRLPSSSTLALEAGQWNLVLFAHPLCPCTRATIEELQEIMARCPGRLQAHVFFYLPENKPADWAETDSWRQASSIHGVTVWPDPHGANAERFGAATSGQIDLFAPGGELRFSGGITGARGHQGENTGRNAVISLVQGQESAATRTPVYGCSLIDETKGEAP